MVPKTTLLNETIKDMIYEMGDWEMTKMLFDRHTDKEMRRTKTRRIVKLRSE